MSVASSSGVEPAAAEIITPESACTALRVEATRVVVCSCVEQVACGKRKLHRQCCEVEVSISRGCGHVDCAWIAGIRAVGRWTELWTGSWKSLRMARSARVESLTAAVVRSARHSFSTASREAASAAMRADVRRQACSTVVWSRPPNWRPIAGSDSPVSSRARYMATWRGHAMRAVRAGERSSSVERPKCVAGGGLDLGDRAACRRRTLRCAGRGCRGPHGASSAVSARPVSELKATTRISAPSSARTLDRRCARRSRRARARRRARCGRAARACAGSRGGSGARAA